MHPLLRAFFLVADAPSAGLSVEGRLNSEVQLVFTGRDEHFGSGPVDPEKVCEMNDMDLQWFFDVKKGKKSSYSTAYTTIAQAVTFLTLIESWEAYLDVNLKTLIAEREIAASRREARIAQVKQDAERRRSEEALNAQADLAKTTQEARDIGETSGVSCRTACEDS